MKQDLQEVKYSYNYFNPNSNVTVTSTLGILEKLPKITLKLPKIDLLQNFELSFC